MTKETMDLCNGEMEEAIASGDQIRIWKANARFNRAMMDCQYKTANRVKWQNKAIWCLISAVAIISCGGNEIVANFVKMMFGR